VASSADESDEAQEYNAQRNRRKQKRPPKQVIMDDYETDQGENNDIHFPPNVGPTNNLTQKTIETKKRP